METREWGELTSSRTANALAPPVTDHPAEHGFTETYRSAEHRVEEAEKAALHPQQNLSDLGSHNAIRHGAF